MTFHLSIEKSEQEDNSLRVVDPGSSNKNGAVSVKGHTKSGWGGPSGLVNRTVTDSKTSGSRKATAKEWNITQGKNKDGSVSIKSHNRKKPKPTNTELKQKKLNNKLAAEGKNFRYTISANGSKKKVSKKQRQVDNWKKKEKEEGATNKDIKSNMNKKTFKAPAMGKMDYK